MYYINMKVFSCFDFTQVFLPMFKISHLGLNEMFLTELNR